MMSLLLSVLYLRALPAPAFQEPFSHEPGAVSGLFV